jgi:hypothetical protein
MRIKKDREIARKLQNSLIVMAAVFVIGGFPLSSILSADKTIGTVPVDQFKTIDSWWRDAKQLGVILVGKQLQDLALEYQKLMSVSGNAFAERMLKSYGGPDASAEMAAAAIAVLTDAGYCRAGGGYPINKALYRSVENDESKLTASVTSIVKPLLSSGKYQMRMVAAEFLLQVHSEGLICLHNRSGNGGRKPSTVPIAVTDLQVKNYIRKGGVIT